MRVKITSAFKKDLKRARKSGKNMEILDTVLGQIQNQCLDSKWKDHPLVGHWVPHHELHLSSACCLFKTEFLVIFFQAMVIAPVLAAFDLLHGQKRLTAASPLFADLISVKASLRGSALWRQP